MTNLFTGAELAEAALFDETESWRCSSISVATAVKKTRRSGG
jgi:hypothetical protein